MERYKTLLGCLLFVVLWSSGWIGSKYGQDYAGTFTLLVYRYVLVVIVLLAFVTFTKSWRPVSPIQFVLHMSVGILSHAVYLGTGNSALLLGVSAGLVAFITALQPMITATMSSSIVGEHTSYRQWVGLMLGFGAIMLVISDKIALGGSIFAYSLPFIAILAISLASLLDRRISLQNQMAKVEPTPLSLVSLIHCTSALIVMVPFAAALEGFDAQWGKELVFSILWLAVIVSLGAYGMMFFMLRMISAIKVASLEYLAPPTTMIIAYFMFGERLTVVDLGGIVLAGIAVWLVISNQEASSLESAPKHATDPILRPPEFRPQSLNAKDKTFSDGISDHTLAFNQHVPTSMASASAVGDTYQPPEELLFQRQRTQELEKLLTIKNQEISRLNLVWEKLKNSHQQITILNRALTEAQLENSARQQDEIELVYLCNRLQDFIKKSSTPIKPDHSLLDENNDRQVDVQNRDFHLQASDVLEADLTQTVDEYASMSNDNFLTPNTGSLSKYD